MLKEHSYSSSSPEKLYPIRLQVFLVLFPLETLAQSIVLTYDCLHTFAGAWLLSNEVINL